MSKVAPAGTTLSETDSRMRVAGKLLDRLGLLKHATDTINDQFDRFPSLVMDRCLADSADLLVEHTVSMFQSDQPLVSEILTMPRRGFGPRPVIVTSPSVRTMYRSFVYQMAEDLPSDTRSGERWKAHSAFGRPMVPGGQPEYLVNLDIASCYEYVEHKHLLDELILRTSDVPVSEAIVQLLGEVTTRSRGLPQLSQASDILADAYLEIIERELLRAGYSVSRIADDFKICAGDWGTANAAIEDTAEFARNLGLVLSTEKTNIRKAQTLLQQEAEENDFFDFHFAIARDSLSTTNFLLGDYGDVETNDVAPEIEEVIAEALRVIFQEWFARRDEDPPLHVRYLSQALSGLARSGDRIPDKWLEEIVFRHPIRLENVCKYIFARRSETLESWLSMDVLTSMRRQSPWAKIWLLHVADCIQSETSCTESAVRDWARRQLGDKHELVRSEAAWFLSRFSDLDADSLGRLYSSASSLTRPALAAACGRSPLPTASGVVKALMQESKLARSAYKWGESQLD